MSDILGDNTNRDFQAQFIELLDLAKKLNAKYDPSVSSESDPMVVLLKQMAMLGDKLEYNKDKAVREQFPSTVQQRSNAAELYDCLGYRIKGWNSATGSVTLSLKNTNLLTEDVGSTIKVAKFTRIADANGLYMYVTTNDVTFDLTGEDSTYAEAKSVGIIEGDIKTLEVGGIDTIGIINMDENYRVYLPDTNVADNGVFVSFSNTIGADFVRVDNPYMLSDQNTYALGENEYGEKYIQFASNIVEILGTENTLSIKYVVSSGSAGMCKAKTLTTIADDTKTENGGVSYSDIISVVQPSATTNGSDPESLEDAYRNFKKKQGTFETLITERDYESHAYNVEYDNAPLYSNVVVASRISDLNRTVKIKTLKNWATRDVYKLIQEASEENSVSEYDVWVYGMQPKGEYDVQFMPVETESSIDILNETIMDVKAVQQVVKDPDGDKRFYWNEYVLVGTVLLKNKVTTSEKAEIEKNMWNALQEYLGARNVSFGEGIDYEGTVSAIVNSDSRILSVILNLPSYQIRRVNNVQGNSDVQYMSPAEKIELVAKMALAGNVQLLAFDSRFSATFGNKTMVAHTPISDDGSGGMQVELPISGVTAITAGVVDASDVDENGSIKLSNLQSAQVTISNTQTNAREIQKNELLMLIGNKYETTVEYGTWVKVLYENKAQAITNSAPITITTANSVLAAGSILKSDGTSIQIYAIQNGVSTYAVIASDMIVELGSKLIGGSTIAAGSEINGVNYAQATILDADTIITQQSILVNGSKLMHGSVLEEPTNETIEGAGVFSISGSTSIGEGSVIAADSTIAVGSVINGTTTRVVLPTNTNYTLSVGETISVEYQDESGAITNKVYGYGTVIETSAEIGSIISNSDTTTTTLGSGDYLRIKDRVSSTLAKGTNYYLAGGTKLTIPAKSGQTPGRYRLGDSEYLIYTSSDLDEIMILNPGTLLENNTVVAVNEEFEQYDLADITSVEDSTIEWKVLPVAIQAYDQEIVTFGEGVKVYTTGESSVKIGREYSPLAAELVVTQEGTTATYYRVIDGMADNAEVYNARYTLNINMTNSQELLTGQFIWANFEIGSSGEMEGGLVFASPVENGEAAKILVIEANEPVVLSGGEAWGGLDLDITLYEETAGVEQLNSNVQKTSAAEIDQLYIDEASKVQMLNRLPDSSGGHIEVIADEESMYTYVKINYTINAPILLPIYVRAAAGTQWKIGVGSNLNAPKIMRLDSDGNPTVLEDGIIDGDATDGSNDRAYTLYLDPGKTTQENVYIIGTNIGGGSFLQIGKPTTLAMLGGDSVATAINAAEIDVTNEDCVAGSGGNGSGFVARDVFITGDIFDGGSTTNAQEILKKISELDQDGIFDYTYIVPDEDKETQPTKSENFFNKNHWCNKYTIPKMDLEKSKKKLIINPGQISK